MLSECRLGSIWPTFSSLHSLVPIRIYEKMTDPMSVIASVITVAGLAYKSSKALCEMIDTVRDAPETFRLLHGDLKALNDVLAPIFQTLEHKKATKDLPAAQAACLQALELPLQRCSDICDLFKSKLSTLMSHSSDTHTSKRDRLRLHFKSDEVESLRSTLGSYKSTLAIALSFVIW